MTRAFGDGLAASVGVIAEPELLEFQLGAQDKYLVLCRRARASSCVSAWLTPNPGGALSTASCCMRGMGSGCMCSVPEASTPLLLPTVRKRSAARSASLLPQPGVTCAGSMQSPQGSSACSDGMFEFLSNQEIVEEVHALAQRGLGPHAISSILVRLTPAGSAKSPGCPHWGPAPTAGADAEAVSSL